MVMTVVAARINRVSARLSVIVSDYLIGYLLSGDGRRPLCHQTLLALKIYRLIGRPQCYVTPVYCVERGK